MRGDGANARWRQQQQRHPGVADVVGGAGMDVLKSKLTHQPADGRSDGGKEDKKDKGDEKRQDAGSEKKGNGRWVNDRVKAFWACAFLVALVALVGQHFWSVSDSHAGTVNRRAHLRTLQ